MNQNSQKLKSSFLITGSSSGLGKYLHDNLGGISLTRQTSKSEKEKIIKDGTDIIIHCAFNSEHSPKNLDLYFRDNVLLTEELTKIPHKKFIFISSVDVYPKDSSKHAEDEILDADKAEDIYAKTKFLSENLVKRNCPNFLILRCTALLGKDSRENSLIKIIKSNHPTLALSNKSVFNYILHKEVLEFIKLAIKNDLQGIYNLASSENITLSQVTKILKKKVNFGNFIYNVGNIDNTKASSIYADLNKTTKEIILEFIS